MKQLNNTNLIISDINFEVVIDGITIHIVFPVFTGKDLAVNTQVADIIQVKGDKFFNEANKENID